MPEPKPSQELPLPQRIDRAIGAKLGKEYKPVDKTWMHVGESAGVPLSTALTLLPLSYDKRSSLAVLNFFVGPNPPQTPEEWNAERHLSIDLRLVPVVLMALGEKKETVRDLPRTLVITDKPDATLKDAERIAETAKTVFERLDAPKKITALAAALEEREHGLSGILGITVAGREALGMQ